MSARERADGARAQKRGWLIALGGTLLRALALTWRIREVNGEPVRALRGRDQPVIYILWHGRMLPLLWHHRRQGVALLVSEHRDGELIARVAASLGYRTVRGSTFRGAQRALLGMIRAVEQGADAAFTPDGPRGPAETFAPGALLVARRTGAPIIPTAAGASRAWRLRSWDAFMIPKPFARVTIAYGDPVPVEAGARADTDDVTHFQSVLRATTARAEG